MNMYSILEFTELAKRLSFTETARYLNMSQPNLSKHINQLERDLHIKLFVRSGNTLALTKEGSLLLPYAYQMLDSENAFLERARELHKSPPASLTISGLTDEGPSTEVLGFLVTLLTPRFGSNCLEIKSRFNSIPREMLEAKEVDIVFDPAPLDEDYDENLIEKIQVAKLRFVALMSTDHPLADKAEITIDDLKNETILKYEGLYLCRSWTHILKPFSDRGYVPKTKSCHCASIAELFALCTNLGSSIVIVGANFGSRIPSGIKNYCVVKPFSDDDAALPLNFLYRRDNTNPALLETIKLLEDMPSPPLEFS